MKYLLIPLLLILAVSAHAGFIGNSNVSGSSVGVGGGCWYAQQFTADSNATTDSIRIYGRSGGIGGAQDTTYWALYANGASDTLPGALIWISKPDSGIFVYPESWKKITMSGITLTAGVKYWIAYGGRSPFRVYETGVADSAYAVQTCAGFNGGSFVDPAGIGGASTAKKLKRGLQVFYTTSGGGGGGGGATGLRVVIQKH